MADSLPVKDWEKARAIRLVRRTQTRVTDVQITTTSAELIKPEPNRIAIAFQSQLTINAVVSPREQVAAGVGFPVSMTAGPTIFTLDQLGEAVTWAWWGAVGVSFYSMRIIETILLLPDILEELS